MYTIETRIPIAEPTNTANEIKSASAKRVSATSIKNTENVVKHNQKKHKRKAKYEIDLAKLLVLDRGFVPKEKYGKRKPISVARMKKKIALRESAGQRRDERLEQEARQLQQQLHGM